MRFATQAGATHIVAHLTNYVRGKDSAISRGNDIHGWEDCSADTLWTYEDLSTGAVWGGSPSIRFWRSHR